MFSKTIMCCARFYVLFLLSDVFLTYENAHVFNLQTKH